MPRIYKPSKPTLNKAAAPVKETKASEQTVSKNDKKKDSGGD